MSKLPFETTGPDSFWGGNSQRGAALGRVSKHGAPDSLRFTLRRVKLDSGGYDQGGAYWGMGKPLYYYESACGNTTGYFRVYAKELGIERNETVLAAYWENKDSGLDDKKHMRALIERFPESADYIGYLFCNPKARTRYLAKLHVAREFPGAKFKG
jgi:hypothetical protein